MWNQRSHLTTCLHLIYIFRLFPNNIINRFYVLAILYSDKTFKFIKSDTFALDTCQKVRVDKVIACLFHWDNFCGLRMVSLHLLNLCSISFFLFMK